MQRRNLLYALVGAMSGGVVPREILQGGRAASPSIAHAGPTPAVPTGGELFAGRPVESFGAVGDDRHDDTAAFLEALAWEREQAGRRLVSLSPGRSYRLRQTLTFDFDGGGLLCNGGTATLNFEMDDGNGIEVYDPRDGETHVSASYFRNVVLLNRSSTAGHAWYYRRARFGHINEDCGALGGWNHYFHYDNSCFGNNALVRPHLEMGKRGRVGIWIGPVCNGLHVLHPEINNPAEVGVEIDATAKSDVGEGPGVNSVVLDHVMTHNCEEAHLRLNGAYATAIRSPRLEAGSSAAPLIVLGDRAACANTLIETPWFQGSGTSRTALELHRSAGITVTEPTFMNVAGPAIRTPMAEDRAITGGLLVHPRILGTTAGLFDRRAPAPFTVLHPSGDVLVFGSRAGLVLQDREDGRSYRIVSRGGRLETELAD